MEGRLVWWAGDQGGVNRPTHTTLQLIKLPVPLSSIKSQAAEHFNPGTEGPCLPITGLC